MNMFLKKLQKNAVAEVFIKIIMVIAAIIVLATYNGNYYNNYH